jgi:hypothetical protein
VARGLASVMRLGGSDWWPMWKLLDCPVEPNLLFSLLRQEMAANGILALNTFNLCLAHVDAAVEAETLAGVDASLDFLAMALNDRDPKSHLRGPMIQPAFRVRAT